MQADGLIYYRGSICSILELTFREMHDMLWEGLSKGLNGTYTVGGKYFLLEDV